MSRLLVTRPAADAAPLAARLEALGHRPILAPLMTIVPVADPAIDLDGVQALLLTSANGVRALAAAMSRRDLPLYAVGGATAEAARDAGFAVAGTAEGTAGTLARLVAARLRPGDGALLHAAGRHRAGGLDEPLIEAGFTLRRTVLYEAQAATQLPAAAAAALGGDGVDGVLLFSPRTAGLFARLVAAAGLEGRLGRVDAFCLSAAVASRLAMERWRNVFVAERPDGDALLALLGPTGPGGDGSDGTGDRDGG